MTHQPPIRVISFASPKGGAGRTMVVANLAVLYAEGCERAGLRPCAVLAVDLDFEAPGLHFYDFAAGLPSGPPVSVTVGGQQVANWDEVRARIAGKSMGALAWLASIMAEVRRPRAQRSTRVDVAVAEETRRLLEDAEGQADSPLNPARHVVRISRDRRPDLILLPAIDPGGSDYRQRILSFDALEFFRNRSGHAILDAIYAHLLRDQPAGVPRRVLLDQGAGFSIEGAINRAYGDHHVIVSGLNEQHRSGLLGLLRSHKTVPPLDTPAAARLSIVLSQYGARTIARDSTRWHHEFLNADEVRWKMRDQLLEAGILARNIHVIDFDSDAVQREFWFKADSEAQDELVALSLAVERTAEAPTVSRRSWTWPELRILGEYVGTPNHAPSGALGGFAAWMRSVLSDHGAVNAFAATHEAIVNLALRGSRGGGPGCPLAPSVTEPHKIEPDQLAKLSLSDFDLVALPFYAVQEAHNALEALAGFSDGAAESPDCLGPMTDAFARSTIHGWQRYARSLALARDPQSKGVCGYPLFVAHELIAVNRRNLSPEWRRSYGLTEWREFRGFLDPADVLAAAQVSKQTLNQEDGLLMPLRKGTVARWYGWRTILAMFRQDGTRLLDESSTWTPEFRRAMDLYVELCASADRRSHSAGWDRCNEIFSKGKVAMLPRWPDAIPMEDRSGYEWIRPPGAGFFEECWLLTVPRHRSPDRPPVAAIEDLLRQFMTSSAQQDYLRLGGLPVHRRVLRSVDNWRDYPFLPHLHWWRDEEQIGTFPARERMLAELAYLESRDESNSYSSSPSGGHES